MAVFQFQRLPLDLKDIFYFYYYGNTEFAFTDGKKNSYDTYSQGLHGGLDFGHGGGGVNVHASVDGIFDYGGDQKAFKPNRVDIVVGRFRILYGHLVNLNPALMKGTPVTADTIIGQVSPQTSHTHLEVRENDTFIRNPLLFFPPDLQNIMFKKTPARIGGDFGFHAWDHWTMPFDQPKIRIGGPVIGPRGTVALSSFDADKLDEPLPSASGGGGLSVPVVAGVNANCVGFNINTRLTKGGMARVIPGTTPNSIKSEPGTTAKHPTSQKLGEIPVGGVVTVVDGPSCVDGILWWKVEYNDASPKLAGWTGEGQGDSYWMEPIVQDKPVTVTTPASTDPSVTAGSGNTGTHVTPSTPVPACPGFNLTTRLSVGGRARVMAGGGSNILKSLPAKSATNPNSKNVGSIPEKGEVKVLEGPSCSDNILWWKVDYNGLVGWTGEGQGSNFWLEPLP